MLKPQFDIWLSLVCGPGSPVPKMLYTEYETAEKIYCEAERERLASIGSIPPETLNAILKKDLTPAERIVDYCYRHNVGLICMKDSRYPERLKSIDSPPPVLYYKGSIPDIDNLACIAVVGTRKASPSARKSAYLISRDLVLGGACVVSGMALGVDGAAAAGAIDGGGHTVAVLGSGIDVVYPPEHGDLMNRIAIGGAVITEFPPHSEPNGRNFPIRNRIISGLSLGTLVVAGDFKSGSLITARRAFEQGRRLFAVPGDINLPESEGPNGLIKDGAQLVTCAEDILMEYKDLFSQSIDVDRMKRMRRDIMIKRQESASPSAMKVAASRAPDYYSGYVPERSRKTDSNSIEDSKAPHKRNKNDFSLRISKNEADSPKKRNEIDVSSLSQNEKTVYTTIPAESPVSADDLAETGLPMSEILVALTMLEINGAVEALPGGLYRKK